MARDTLTGSRIRERRVIAGIKQADLARIAGISPSYLNLIEHNRRRIGGKLLLAIAQALKVEPSLLSEGAEAALIGALREAATLAPEMAAETGRADEFAGRFPGWARLVVWARDRVGQLARTVEQLSDRLAHDPHLAASLHEVLSTATAIRSTATILAETRQIEPEWRDRFHRNINEDAARLAGASTALVRYLDSNPDAAEIAASPQEEVAAVIARHGAHFPELEAGRPVARVLRDLGAPENPAVQFVLTRHLARYAADAAAMPLGPLLAAMAETGADPAALAARFGAGCDVAIRRLAGLPEGALPAPPGLVGADRSGTFLWRQPVAGFALPRFGAACPLWPLFSAFARPGQPLRHVLHQSGRDGGRFLAYSHAAPVGGDAYDPDAPLQSWMLILPLTRDGDPDPDVIAREVGPSCGICPRADCAARREPSLLGDAG